MTETKTVTLKDVATVSAEAVVETPKAKKEKLHVAGLPKLKGDAKKQFAAVLKANAELQAAVIVATEVPIKHLRILRRDLNVHFIATVSTRVPSKAERIAARIAKLEAALAELS